MSLNPEWNITCRICLQESETRSLFDICPGSNLTYCAKVMKCTNVEIYHNDSLPEQICLPCIEDLNVAYRFRVNCESSDAILQSYKEAVSTSDNLICEGLPPSRASDDDDTSSEIHIPIGSDVLYSYKPPLGLNVKLLSKESITEEDAGKKRIREPSGGDVKSDDIFAAAKSSTVAHSDNELSIVHQEDDTDSLITFDDALPRSSSREDEYEAEEPSELIDEEGSGEEDNLAVAANEKHEHDNNSNDIFFSTVYMNNDEEGEDLLNQLAKIKSDDEGDEWEVIYDDALSDDNSDCYFQKIPQPKAARKSNSAIEAVSEKGATQPMTATSNMVVKTIQTIRKANVPNEEKPTIENITTKPGPDGSLETVIRVKRNLKTTKQQHVCKLCNSSYKYKHALETHLRRHRGDKPYKCTECEKAFVVPFELRRHMRTHTGAKPYKCKYCDRKFSDFGSKIKHERTHTGERPYTCEICEKSFTYSHVLNSHMLIHTGVKKYSCLDCGKRFAKSHHLKAHQNTHVRTNISTSFTSSQHIGKTYTTGGTSKEDSALDSSIETDQSNMHTSTPSEPSKRSRIISSSSVPAGDDSMGLNPTTESSNVDQLMVDALDHRSTDFQLDDPAGSNPFGQLVNIGDYMISAKNGASSIGTIMDDCVIHDGVPDDDDVGDVDGDPLLNVVTVLTSNQVASLVEADYANIRIINGSNRHDPPPGVYLMTC